MASDSLSRRKAQLDREERERLEGVVADMRERVEDNVRFQLAQTGLDDEPEDVDSLDEDTEAQGASNPVRTLTGTSSDSSRRSNSRASTANPGARPSSSTSPAWVTPSSTASPRCAVWRCAILSARRSPCSRTTG
ncbi:hypothetical protein ACFQJD_07620 [Haloplanus sp. GCM10025708]